MVAQTLFEPVWIGWNEQTAGLASGWWRDEILANSAIAGVYAKSDDWKISHLKKNYYDKPLILLSFPPHLGTMRRCQKMTKNRRFISVGYFLLLKRIIHTEEAGLRTG